MRKYVCVTIILLGTLARLQAQDLTFSQFYEQPLLRNPALAGVFNEDVRVVGAFRNQWQSVTVPYQTEALSAEIKLPRSISDNLWTVGLQVTNDEAGDVKLRRTQLLPAVSWQVKMRQDGTLYLGFGLMAGYVSNQFDPTKARFDDQFVNGSYDPSNPTSQTFTQTGTSYFDFNFGTVLTGSFTGDKSEGYYYGGIAVFHINKPSIAAYTGESNVHLDRKLAINGGLVLPTSDANNIVAFGDFFRQGGNNQFLAGLLYSFDLSQNFYGDDPDIKTALYLGAIYRWNDAIAPTLKLNWNNLAFGFSYDANISSLSTASQFRGGFELTFSFKGDFRQRSQLPCPHFVF